MIVKNKKSIKKHLAVNEVSILRQSRQAASLSINYGSKQIIKELVSDGVLVSTSQVALLIIYLFMVQYCLNSKIINFANKPLQTKTMERKDS